MCYRIVSEVKYTNIHNVFAVILWRTIPTKEIFLNENYICKYPHPKITSFSVQSIKRATDRLYVHTECVCTCQLNTVCKLVKNSLEYANSERLHFFGGLYLFPLEDKFIEISIFFHGNFLLFK